MASALIQTKKGPLVLLFYDGFEWRAREGQLDRIKASVRRIARFSYRSALRKQVHTGFYTAFLALRRSLERHGCDVRVNDFRIARRLSNYPIGIAGFPSVLQAVQLANPKIFGPGDFGLPVQAAHLASDDQIRTLIQPSKWFSDLYRPYCGDKLATWFAGIDTEAWPDLSRGPKKVDVLIYDKIHWYRDREVPEVIGRLTSHLERRGLSWQLLRYGFHHRSMFRAALSTARSLAFISQHETQGLACQEALSSGVPVFAWNEGVLVDPQLTSAAPPDLGVSSVPYFDDRCGRTFRKAELEPEFDAFWSELKQYDPRNFVLENLSLEQSARCYLQLYSAAF